MEITRPAAVATEVTGESLADMGMVATAQKAMTTPLFPRPGPDGKSE